MIEGKVISTVTNGKTSHSRTVTVALTVTLNERVQVQSVTMSYGLAHALGIAAGDVIQLRIKP